MNRVDNVYPARNAAPETITTVKHSSSVHFSDSLCCGKGENKKSSFCSFFQWIWEKITAFFSAIFSCWGDSSNKENVEIKPKLLPKEKVLKENINKIETLIREFPQNQKIMKKKPFKKWWRHTFEGLNPEIQKAIRVQYLKMYATKQEEIKDKDLDKWMQENYDLKLHVANDFVVELHDAFLKGQIYSPKQEIPKFLQVVKTDIERNNKLLA